MLFDSATQFLAHTLSFILLFMTEYAGVSSITIWVCIIFSFLFRYSILAFWISIELYTKFSHRLIDNTQKDIWHLEYNPFLSFTYFEFWLSNFFPFPAYCYLCDYLNDIISVWRRNIFEVWCINTILWKWKYRIQI